MPGIPVLSIENREGKVYGHGSHKMPLNTWNYFKFVQIRFLGTNSSIHSVCMEVINCDISFLNVTVRFQSALVTVLMGRIL